MEEQAQIQPRIKHLSPCPVCGAFETQQILEIHQIPIIANVLWEKRADALSAPRGDIQLAFCRRCGHVFNKVFDPGLIEYDVQYENSLHFSPLFQEYADWLAHYLIDRHGLRGKKIIEIGSGKGDFLRMLCDYGNNTGTGFDPSFQPEPSGSHPAVSFVNDVYSERYAYFEADLILSRHVLEHIYQPSEFVQNLRRTIGTREQTVVFCEVPNFSYILRDNAVWDIIYEHVSYFSAPALLYLFSRSGFEILNIVEAFHGQFLFVEAVPAETNIPSPSMAGGQTIASIASQVDGFASHCQQKISGWNDRLRALRMAGKRVVLWGAGSKGISFLNMIHVGDAVDFIVDINPRKHGKYVTGSGQKIVQPDFLAQYRPDYIIIMNPIYRDEIWEMTTQLGLHVDFLTAS